MSELTKIPESFIQDIMFYNIVHNHRGSNKFSILFVTNNDQVYGLGDNSCGQLGLGHNYDNKAIQEVLALKHKQIKQLSSNGECHFAMSHDNSLYSWGWNKHGQLGRPSENHHEYQPIKVNFNFPSAIKQIEIAHIRTLILLDCCKLFVLSKFNDTNTYCRQILENLFE